MNSWQETLQVISDYDAIAKWTLKDGYGFFWMLIPEKKEIKENGFSKTVMSPLLFEDLEYIEIHKCYKLGCHKEEYYIESIQKAISSKSNLKVSYEDEVLKIERM